MDKLTQSSWDLESAVHLCKEIESLAPNFGCHVALTGGCLYKEGGRKDVDLLFYRIRQVDKVDIEGLFQCLWTCLDIKKISGFGWCYKATCHGRGIDCFFPEEQGGLYCPPTEEEKQDKPLSDFELGLI